VRTTVTLMIAGDTITAQTDWCILQDVDAAAENRCVNELGMIGIAVAPNIPILILKRLIPDVRS